MASSARQTKGTARAGSTARTGTSARKRRFFNYPRSHVKSFRRWLPSWRVLLGTFLTGTALVAGIVIAAYATTSVPAEPAYAVQQQKTTVYYADGVTEIGTFQEENRVIVDYAATTSRRRRPRRSTSRFSSPCATATCPISCTTST